MVNVFKKIGIIILGFIPFIVFAQINDRFGVPETETMDEAMYWPSSGLGLLLIYSWIPLAVYYIWKAIYVSAIHGWEQLKNSKSKFGIFVLDSAVVASFLELLIPYIVSKAVCPYGYDFLPMKRATGAVTCAALG